jgi:hypothetical protein
VTSTTSIALAITLALLLPRRQSIHSRRRSYVTFLQPLRRLILVSSALSCHCRHALHGSVIFVEPFLTTNLAFVISFSLKLIQTEALSTIVNPPFTILWDSPALFRPSPTASCPSPRLLLLCPPHVTPQALLPPLQAPSSPGAL